MKTESFTSRSVSAVTSHLTGAHVAQAANEVSGGLRYVMN